MYHRTGIVYYCSTLIYCILHASCLAASSTIFSTFLPYLCCIHIDVELLAMATMPAMSCPQSNGTNCHWSEVMPNCIASRGCTSSSVFRARELGGHKIRFSCLTLLLFASLLFKIDAISYVYVMVALECIPAFMLLH